MARDLSLGDLVTHRSRSEDLFVVIGYTYRVSVYGNRRLVRLFCGRTGQVELIIEEQLVMITPANKKTNTEEQ